MSGSEPGALLDPAAFQRLRAWGGDELLGKIVSLFLEHAPTRLAEVETGLAEGDLERVERGAHALKSSAANLGGTALQQVCTRLEAAAEAGNEAEVAALAPDFRRSFHQTVAALERHGGRT